MFRWGFAPRPSKPFCPVHCTIYRAKVYNFGYKSTLWQCMYEKPYLKTVKYDKASELQRKMFFLKNKVLNNPPDKEKLYFFWRGLSMLSSVIKSVFKMSAFYQRNLHMNFGTQKSKRRGEGEGGISPPPFFFVPTGSETGNQSSPSLSWPPL